ncbi:MAG: DeoR/GlpR family DNA-binding transcription regulator [Nocardioides sp.]
MIAEQRRARILAHLERDGSVRVSDLVEVLGVSDMTIRRDLEVLHGRSMLEKVHGGAVARAEPATSEPGFEAKSARRLAEKEAIAARAAAMVSPGSAIAVSAGTTTYALAKHLITIPGLTVVTNSVRVADVLYRQGMESMSVLLTGGHRTPSDALVGPLAIAALKSLHLDAAFMGVHGMDAEAGFSTPNLLEAETNRSMVGSARRLVVLADSSKWGIVGLSSMARLADATIVISDSKLGSTATTVLRDHTDLELVSPDSTLTG